MSSSAHLNMVANLGSSIGSNPVIQGLKVIISNLNAGLTTIKPLSKADSAVDNQVIMCEFSKQLRRVLTSHNLTEKEFDAKYIETLHAKVLAKSLQLPALDGAIEADKSLFLEDTKLKDILLRDLTTAQLKPNGTLRENNDRDALILAIQDLLVAKTAKLAATKASLKVKHYESHAFSVHLSSLNNLAEINECIMFHLARIIPTHLRDLALQHIDANFGSMSIGLNHNLGSQFGIPIVQNGQAPPPEPDIFTEAAMTTHRVLEKPAANLTQWLRFLNFWQTKHGITSSIQLTEFKRQISVVDEDNRLLPHNKLEDWLVKQFQLRNRMLKDTEYAFRGKEEIILFVNMVNHDDHPRFQQLIAEIFLTIDKSDFAATPDDLEQMYSSFIAADNAHWLQNNLKATPLDVNAVWKSKGTQKTKIAAHGGPKLTNPERTHANMEKARIICDWCLNWGHTEQDCRGKKEGKMRKPRTCHECKEEGHTKFHCPKLKKKALSVGTTKNKAVTQANTKSSKKSKKVSAVELPDDDQVTVDMVELSDPLTALTVNSLAEEIIIDSGSQVHCLRNKPTEGFVEQAVTSIPSLKFGNGQELPSSAVGVLGSGALKNTVICAGLSNNLLSVIQLTASGITVVNTSKGCYIIKGNVNFKGTDVLAFAPMSKGLYRMPLEAALDTLENL